MAGALAVQLCIVCGCVSRCCGAPVRFISGRRPAAGATTTEVVRRHGRKRFADSAELQSRRITRPLFCLRLLPCVVHPFAFQLLRRCAETLLQRVATLRKPSDLQGASRAFRERCALYDALRVDPKLVPRSVHCDCVCLSVCVSCHRGRAVRSLAARGMPRTVVSAHGHRFSRVGGRPQGRS